MHKTSAALKFSISLLSLLLLIAISAVTWAQASDEIKNNSEIDRDNPFGVEIDLEATEFSNETRLGLGNSTGNTRSITAVGSNSTKYRYKRWENLWKAGGRYERVFSSTTGTAIGTSARFIYGTYRLDYYFTPRFTTFAGGGGYSDRIKGVDLAGEGFGGVQFIIIRTPRTSLSFSTGYDFTYEDRVPPAVDKKIHSVLANATFSKKLGKVVTLKENLDLLENVRDGHDLRIRNKTELDLKVAEHLSVLLSFTLTFDNLPVPGYKKLDTFTDFQLSVNF